MYLQYNNPPLSGIPELTMREHIKMVESFNNELVPLNIFRHKNDKLKLNNSGINLH